MTYTKPIQKAPGLVWFRRDLRDFDHAALAGALGAHREVHCAFLFDTEILEALASRADARVTFIWESVRELDATLAARGGGLHVLHGRAREEIPRLARELGVGAVHANRDYEPAAIARDEEVAARLRAAGIAFQTYKDQVVFERDEVLTQDGRPFSVFTPYRAAWMKALDRCPPAPHGPRVPGARLAPASAPLPPLERLGFVRRPPAVAPGMSGGARALAAFRARLRDYAAMRDFPAAEATSGLSVHLRFGTVSIRELVGLARRRRRSGGAAWLSELAWREFFFAVLAARPDVVEHAFRPAYDALPWEDDDAGWQAWCHGRTGYPLVDAAMRELEARGTMHNRLRMLTASFLVKHLGIDWRRGERHFAARLLDYDLAANNGNWQWCASTGCDAQPYFRILNPVLQSRRFDPEGLYMRRWMPELALVAPERLHAPWEMSAAEQRAARCVIGREYPFPIVAHQAARRRALERYRAVAHP